MRIIKTEVIQETRSSNMSPRTGEAKFAGKTEKLIKKEIKVILDSYEQRAELAAFLKSKKFKQTDGFLGEQRDYSVGASYAAGKEELYVTLDFQNQRRYERLIQTVISWTKK